MKEAVLWRPSKAALLSGQWRASPDPTEISPGSRAIGDWMIAAYASAITAHARGALVDLGCGKFPYYGIYRDRITSVIGIDWPNSLHDNPHVDRFCDLNEGIDLPDACADTVICTDVLEHIYTPARLWSAIARILKPGGKAIIGTPFYYWIHEAPHDYYRYTRFALERQATESGLTVIEIQAIGGLPHILTDLLCKLCQHKPITRPLVVPLYRLMRLMLRFGPVQRFARSSASQFPLAYVTIVAKPASGLSGAGSGEEVKVRP